MIFPPHFRDTADVLIIESIMLLIPSRNPSSRGTLLRSRRRIRGLRVSSLVADISLREAEVPGLQLLLLLLASYGNLGIRLRLLLPMLTLLV